MCFARARAPVCSSVMNAGRSDGRFKCIPLAGARAGARVPSRTPWYRPGASLTPETPAPSARSALPRCPAIRARPPRSARAAAGAIARAFCLEGEAEGRAVGGVHAQAHLPPRAAVSPARGAGLHGRRRGQSGLGELASLHEHEPSGSWQAGLMPTAQGRGSRCLCCSRSTDSLVWCHQTRSGAATTTTHHDATRAMNMEQPHACVASERGGGAQCGSRSAAPPGRNAPPG